jgi:hypothetical protein
MAFRWKSVFTVGPRGVAGTVSRTCARGQGRWATFLLNNGAAGEGVRLRWSFFLSFFNGFV